MSRTVVILTLCVVIIVFFASAMMYLVSLEDAPPTTELERKGRAQYLVDIRWPRLDIKGLLFGE